MSLCGPLIPILGGEMVRLWMENLKTVITLPPVPALLPLIKNHFRNIPASMMKFTSERKWKGRVLVLASGLGRPDPFHNTHSSFSESDCVEEGLCFLGLPCKITLEPSQPVQGTAAGRPRSAVQMEIEIIKFCLVRRDYMLVQTQ
jgi:hypothetical protein